MATKLLVLILTLQSSQHKMSTYRGILDRRHSQLSLVLSSGFQKSPEWLITIGRIILSPDPRAEGMRLRSSCGGGRRASSQLHACVSATSTAVLHSSDALINDLFRFYFCDDPCTVLLKRGLCYTVSNRLIATAWLLRIIDELYTIFPRLVLSRHNLSLSRNYIA